MYTIHDEDLIAKLEAMAAQEARSVEEILTIALEFYLLAQTTFQDIHRPAWQQQPENIQKVLHKAYDKARRYWAEHNESQKAALTDEQLYEQFGRFDKEGIPRLKSELTSLEPQPGSLAYSAWSAHHQPLPLEREFNSDRKEYSMNDSISLDSSGHKRGKNA